MKVRICVGSSCHLKGAPQVIAAFQDILAQRPELSAQVEGEGLTLTGRFSPGYGDLPLTLQPALLERMQAYRIGLTVNAGGQLQPEKSVTALCGLRSGEEEQP